MTTLSPAILNYIQQLSKSNNDVLGMNKYLNPSYKPKEKFDRAKQGERYSGGNDFSVSPTEQSTMSDIDKFLQNLGDNYADTMARQNKYTKANRAVGVVNDLATGGLALGQIFRSINRGRSTNAPKRPEAPLEDHLLNTRISEAIEEAKNINPRLRSLNERDVAVNYERDNARAKNFSAGNSAIYQAISQLNSTKANDAMRRANANLELMRDRKEARADELVGRKLFEDNARFDRARRDYRDIDIPEFNRQRNFNAKLNNAGLENLFKLLNSLTPSSR